MTEYTPEELKAFSGEEGKPVYIAYQGRIIDVTGSKLWKGGLHMRRHHAGADLTADIQAAPHTVDVLARYPQVGILKKADADAGRPMSRALAALLEKFPFLERHPHPMTVHFPIVFMISAVIFNTLFLITELKSFEETAWHCLGGSVIFTPVAMATGLFTWWLNYAGKPLRPVTIKITLSVLSWILSIIAFSWRFAVPDILIVPSSLTVVYGLIILSLFPMVSAIGWYGAHLTFPLRMKE